MFLLFLIAPLAAQVVEIHSPRLTSYGHWHDWHGCPHDHFAAGMQVKAERDQGGGHGDDTGLNAVRLFCRPIESDSVEQHHWIMSGEGPWGDWQAVKWCPPGTSMLGFQLRSEPVQYGGDDTGADNFAAYCGHYTDDRPSGHRIQGDTRGWGDWTESQFCMPGYLVCGMQTQVEGRQGNGDDTALNNVNLRCCKIHLKDCVPEVRLKTIREIDNLRGSGRSTYEIGYKVAHTRTTGHTVTASQSEKQSYTNKFMFNLGGTVNKVNMGFNAEFGYSRERISAHDVQNMIQEAVNSERYEKLMVEVLPYTRAVIKQLTITCNQNVLQLDKTTIASYRN